MKPSFMSQKKRLSASKRITVFLLFFILIFGATLAPLKPAKAIPVEDIPARIWDFVRTLWQKGGSIAFQQTLRIALNKIAYDTATWIGSGGEGQKPLFVSQDWGSYMAQIGDEAAGDFLEHFAANWSESQGTDLTFNFCQPSSLDVKVKIALGLAQQYRPQGPSCTASEMIANWESAAQKYSDYKDPQFLDKFVNIFDPVSNDMGIFMSASTDMMNEQWEGEKVAETTLLGKGGWLDLKGPDGNSLTLPNQAQLQIEGEYEKYAANFSQYTGDAFIDAANVFLNQLAITAFNNLLKNIGKKNTSNDSTPSILTSFTADPSSTGGETALKESAVKLIQPDFGVRTDYSILSELMMCPDPKNPGPTNCVIDNKLMQAISEKKTVAEALEQGYLHGEWQFTIDTQPAGPESSYSWRNVSILRKYRIVPASWELVFDKLKKLNQLATDEPDRFLPKQATMQDLVSCFDPYDEFNQFSSQFNAADQAWCVGLVDPHWVLKAPLNYCEKEGAGAQILHKSVIPSQKAYGDNPYVPSTISVIRADNYCADSQTCIQEAKDGSCQAYGYCNEEKRIWSFDGDSCSPINNTCQAFVNSSSGQKVAYLENTLDYEGCSAENAGCKQYSDYGTYDVERGTVAWSTTGNIYFNSKAEDCAVADEGCSEFIRVKPSWGANLVMNANFINDQVGASTTGTMLNDWPVSANKTTIVDSALEPGNSNGKALKLEGSDVRVYSNETNSLLPDNLDIIPGQSYTVSADVFLVSGSRVTISLGNNPNQSNYSSQLTGSWHHISVTKHPGAGLGVPEFSISANGTLYVKNIKFEMSSWDTGFSSYAATKSYQKILPEYLEEACYIGETVDGDYDYKIKENAPSICYKYARKCDQGEVGCELYSAGKNSFSVPAKVSSADYCPSECVGYDIYVSRESYFSSPQAENLIPSTATACNANSAGCTEFTNLDDLATGGESKEYYSALKQCVKPGQATCGNFYAWEGTANGYQLRLYTLEQAASGGPTVIADDSALCNATIFTAGIDSPLYNPDCRQFYDAAGQIFYHLTTHVITCSDNCRAYRMTEKNYDRTLTAAQCSGTDRNWDTQEGACVVCLNGGTWNSTHQSCVYQGIPGEGKSCSAAENGCREYNGSNGNNVRLVSSYDFEAPSSDWTSNCSNGISLAAIASSRDGHSLLYNNSATGCSEIGSDTRTLSRISPLINQIFATDSMAAQLKVGSSVQKDKAYNVRFWASAPTGARLKIYFYNKDTGERSNFNNGKTINVASGGGWQLYSANLENLNHNVSPNEILVIVADNNFYLDNFILTEIADRYYLIKGSSQIPNICYYDILDNYQGADYNLGCATYSDRAGNGHNLHSFSNICDETSVGCEQVISTKNYNPYGGNIWGDQNSNGLCESDEGGCVRVDGDSAMYVVFDRSKQCSSASLGCSRFGQAQAGTNASVWSDVFRKNNPNNYDKILCDEDGLGCEAWQMADVSGISYFRDPGSNICVYRSSQEQATGQKSWYKAPVKRCDSNADGRIEGGERSASICASADDCSGQPCIVDNNDYLCDITYLETIGYGGPGNRIPVPSEEAALCDVKASGCREYIDPVSQFNPDLATGDTSLSLQPNKLYLLTSSGSTAISATLTFTSPVAELLSNNTFGTSTNSVSIDGSRTEFIFNSLNNNSATVNNTADEVVLRELAIEYQLAASIDKQGCNGLVNFNNGCILFNERAIAGASGYVSLENGFDPYASVDKLAPKVCDPSIDGSCVTNQLIKVRPDRVCANWFDCETYALDEQTGEKVCYSLRQCNSLDDQGNCNNFVDDEYQPLINNASGYYFLGKESISNMQEVGLNSGAHYDFEELVPSLSCARVDNSGEPCSFDRNIIKDLLIREPEQAKVDYPVSGKTYLKVPSAYNVSPMADGAWLNLTSNQEYYLSFLVNTKNSGSDAQVVIKINGVPGTTTFTVSSPNGWTRVVRSFNSGNSSTGSRQVRISLQASEATGEGEVYFDDINIEPVLKMSEGQYAGRECRLYPSNDSLSCKNQNKNVIANGLEGYCLEHDRDNPSVCTTWYPADRISSSALSSNSLGYNGPVGLSYCTNVNANLEYAKKVTTKLVYYNVDHSRGTFITGIIDWITDLVTGTECPEDWNDPDNPDMCAYCQSFDKTPYCPAALADPTNCQECEKMDGEAGVIRVDDDYCATLPRGSATDQRTCDYHCGDCDYYQAVVVNDKMNWNHERVYCVPRENSPYFLLPVGSKVTAAVYSDAEFDVPSCRDLTFYTEAWMTYKGSFIQKPAGLCEPYEDMEIDCEAINEAVNADPPIRVYNRDYRPADEQGLQYLSADSNNRDKVFNFTCNTFTQVVSTSGENKAWAVRTGISSDPADAFETPSYFKLGAANTLVNLQKYGRQRNGVPFGAATFSVDYDLLNSGPVYFQNQYYLKDKKTIFAGRPYDCTGTACDKIGYCEGNPSVMCLFDPYNPTETSYINQKTCSDGGFGYCLPLWATSTGLTASNILSNIFLQSYGTFSYNEGSYIPSSYNYNTLPTPGSDPIVRNPQLMLGTAPSPGLTAERAGIYALKFNTQVNAEQQPLRMIYIDWGDGNRQAFTGYDHRPNADSPHVFYHYYSGATTESVSIKIWDNWDRTGGY